MIYKGFETLIKKNKKNLKKVLTFEISSYIITLASGRDAKNNKTSGCGSAWLERLVWDQEVAGSNPVTPIHAGVVQW